MEADARAEADAARPAYEAKQVVYDSKTGRRGRPPKPPDDEPPPERQSNLTDPDSALMRRSDAHEFRQAYNAQAVVCADGTQLVLATKLVATTADAPSFATVILGMQDTIGLPTTVLADTGYASAAAVASLQANGIEPLVAIGRTQPHRPYDFRPPPGAKDPAADHRALAHRHEGQVGERRWQEPIQNAQADRPTRIRHHQKCHRLHTIPATGPGKRSNRVEPGHTGLQLQADRPNAAILTGYNRQISLPNFNHWRPQSDRLLGFGRLPWAARDRQEAVLFFEKKNQKTLA